MTSSRGCSSSVVPLALVMLGLCAPLRAAQIGMANAEREGQRYRVHVEARLAAPLDAVRALLTDYPHLGRVNPSIKSSVVLPSATPGIERVRLVSEVCVWIYCKRLHQVQDMRQSGAGVLEATVLPDVSDFRYGYARIALRSVPGGTSFSMRGELEPDFWIPPFIGPWLIKRKLLEEARVTVEQLERLASGRERPDQVGTGEMSLTGSAQPLPTSCRSGLC